MNDLFSTALTGYIACAVYAVYSVIGIKGFQETFLWHLFQWASFLLIMMFGAKVACYFFVVGVSWHSFGNLVSLSVIGIPIYVIVLRIFQRYL